MTFEQRAAESVAIANLMADNATLRRQVDELRRALKEIRAEASKPLSAENMYAPLGPFYRAKVERMAETARTALARVGGGGGEGTE